MIDTNSMMPVDLIPDLLAIALLFNLKGTWEWGQGEKNQSSVEGLGTGRRLNKRIDCVLLSGWVPHFCFL